MLPISVFYVLLPALNLTDSNPVGSRMPREGRRDRRSPRTRRHAPSAIRTSSATHESVLAYVAFGPQTAGTVNGLPAHPGLLLAAEPKAPTLQRRP
jgi:hypothetical protein